MESVVKNITAPIFMMRPPRRRGIVLAAVHAIKALMATGEE
jgi:hypothetical protein